MQDKNKNWNLMTNAGIVVIKKEIERQMEKANLIFNIPIADGGCSYETELEKHGKDIFENYSEFRHVDDAVDCWLTEALEETDLFLETRRGRAA